MQIQIFGKDYFQKMKVESQSSQHKKKEAKSKRDTVQSHQYKRHQQDSKVQLHQNGQEQYKQLNNERGNSPIIDVPTYKLQIKQTNFEIQGEYIAIGTLIGKFYQLEETIKEQQCKFTGSFKGSTELKNNGKYIYFEGQISNLNFIQVASQTLKDELENDTKYNGYFRGNFYKLSEQQKYIQQKKSKQINKNQINLNSVGQQPKPTPMKERKIQTNQIITNVKNQIKNKQYFLPSVLRFEVRDVRQINLQKSMATISGRLFFKIFYDQQVGDLIKESLKFRKEKLQKKKERKQNKISQKLNKNQNSMNEQPQNQVEKKEQEEQKKQQAKLENLLTITVNFNRDFNLVFHLFQEEDDDDDANSQDSQWTIQDKTWDIELQHNQLQKTYEFKVWKKFNAQIDNSFGAFYAPFNLNVLRLVVTVHGFNVVDKNEKKIKVNLLGTDVLDFYDSQNDKSFYNPFRPLNDLDYKDKQQNKESFSQRQNRLYKINNLKCQDNGVFIIANNRLTIFPHYKQTLINKCTANQSWLWGLGLQNKKQLLKTPQVRSISQMFEQFNSSTQPLRYKKFSKLLWNYFFIQIPIFRYLMVEMLQIFAPLIFLSIVSLLIFNQSNGVSDGGFTTLSARIVNVCSLMIAYVSLIPSLRKSLPPMPSITLVEIITYVSTIPNLLALVQSMINYTISLQEWIKDYFVFKDTVFLICFIITMINNIIFTIILIVYSCKKYTIVIDKNFMLKGQEQKNKIKYRSPWARYFMKTINKRPSYSVSPCPKEQKQK